MTALSPSLIRTILLSVNNIKYIECNIILVLNYFKQMVEKSAEALDKEFNDAVNYIQNSKDPNIKLSNNDKLKFYSLYK